MTEYHIPSKPIRFYHWWIYRLFRATWNPLLRERPRMVDGLIEQLNQWRRSDNGRGDASV